MRVFVVLLVSGCVGVPVVPPDGFSAVTVPGEEYTIFTWQRLTDNKSPVHIYIEGDGHAFDAYGIPTNNPTPRDGTLRKMAFNDPSNNVVYMARPCQFILDESCNTVDWTVGRFSSKLVDVMAQAIKSVAGHRPIIMVGYSGGALISGLVIDKNPGLNVRGWVTVAGVLNHSDWTHYFDDSTLNNSLNLNTLPHLPQRHYVAEHDTVVPYELSYKWTYGHDMVVVPDSSHGDFGDFVPDFSDLGI